MPVQGLICSRLCLGRSYLASTHDMVTNLPGTAGIRTKCLVAAALHLSKALFLPVHLPQATKDVADHWTD